MQATHLLADARQPKQRAANYIRSALDRLGDLPVEVAMAHQALGVKV